jgi:hypothetical protein
MKNLLEYTQQKGERQPRFPIIQCKFSFLKVLTKANIWQKIVG